MATNDGCAGPLAPDHGKELKALERDSCIRLLDSETTHSPTPIELHQRRMAETAPRVHSEEVSKGLVNACAAITLREEEDGTGNAGPQPARTKNLGCVAVAMPAAVPGSADRSITTTASKWCSACYNECIDPQCEHFFEVSSKEHGASTTSWKSRRYTMCHVMYAVENGRSLIVANRKVYDCTDYLASGKHPGGEKSLRRNLGLDASKHFKMHSRAGRQLWKKFVIGKLVPCPGLKDSELRPKRPWSLEKW